MITVLRTPLGHKLDSNQQEGELTNAGGDALVTTDSNHGLSDGDYVYMESNFDSYNGFKYVDSVSYTEFKIKDSATGDYVQFKQNADVTFYVSVLNHGWQCVHLPIVYELESSLFPSNLESSEYVTNTVDSFADYNGNVQLNFDQALEDPTALSKIKLVGTGPLAGVYQIINVLQPWSVVIDLDYDATYSFLGYTVEKYYDNYCINVTVYAGLLPGHRWEDEKPVRLLGTLKFVPDSNNRVLFSISELLRGLIKTVNNLTLDTLPNNIDFITEFYIGYYESYDVSDGDVITMFEGVETTDDFMGVAVNAKNEFKNQYSGHLSDYVSDDGYPAQWLTDFDRPVAVVGYNFDISFLSQYNIGDILVIITKSSGIELVTIEEPGLGLIRVPITPESGETEYCLTAYSTSETDETPFDLTDFDNFGTGTSWVTGANPSFTSPVGSWESTYLRIPFSGSEINTIELVVSKITDNIMNVRIGYMDSSGNELSYEDFSSSGVTGAQTFSPTIIEANEYAYLFVRVSGSNSNEFEITSFSTIQPLQVTQEICIDIIEECGTTFNETARITEAEIIRIIE